MKLEINNNKNLFAPVGRESVSKLNHEALILNQAEQIDHIANVIPVALMTLNKQRQLVYSNRRLLDLLKLSSSHDIIGLRPGEILNCIHAQSGCDGCGTSEFCSKCDAAQAIKTSQQEKIGTHGECLITPKTGEPFELNVWASPYTFNGIEYTVFSILDIHEKKRREALEQTFFHDIANVVNAITCHSEMLEMFPDDSHSTESIKAISVASKELATEIWSHRKLLEAENGELIPTLTQLDASECANDLLHIFTFRPIQIDPFSSNFSIETDHTLLFRIILNMLKNAHEAASKDDVVTLSYRKESNRGVFSVHNPNFMPRAVQLQIFQRSFSTQGSGRGLGTYSMRLFGEKYMHGNIGFNTSEENGTTFYISLPLNHPDHP